MQTTSIIVLLVGFILLLVQRDLCFILLSGWRFSLQCLAREFNLSSAEGKQGAIGRQSVDARIGTKRAAQRARAMIGRRRHAKLHLLLSLAHFLPQRRTSSFPYLTS